MPPPALARGPNYSAANLSCFLVPKSQASWRSWRWPAGSPQARLTIWPRFTDGRSPRLTLEGPEVRLQPKAAVTLALVFHELAANAQNYGALSVPEGLATLMRKCARPPSTRG